ncbi:sigma-54-dependent transcriptional regulator [Pokkaliibacter sp. CJK22405]|uniref:sigma-54-dependent transcriptional regulator n=1 Tax=Pokkaliibacter sp. CJK22405 TaxID=3384615 RepID=UPI0039851B70
MSQHARILLVDDEPAFCALCSRWLTAAGHEVATASDLTEARQVLARFDADLMLLDLALPPAFDPMETLSAVPEFISRPVIILTGHGDRSLALEAIRQGAWDLLSKPIDPDMLAVVVRRALSKHRLEQEVARLRHDQQRQDSLDRRLVGVSPGMQALRTLVQRIAPTDVRVLVTGPSGTGKEVISRALHDLSLRRQGPFISVHCGAIPADLLESELFGHAKGAFTGADRDRQGLLKLADGGTLFLDEIGEMPLPMQVKLLRVLQEGSFYPVGGRELQQIDVRVISATNASLPEKVAAGSFREDLYYRIKGVTLETRALNERPEDIPALLKAFLLEIGMEATALSASAMSWFMSRQWPGNVRELKATLESVVAVCVGLQVTLDDIALLHPSAQGDAGIDPSDTSLESQVRALEMRLIRQALSEAGGNRSQAATTLHLSRQGLLNKMERYGLN